jgi:bromodomain-containing protein 8
MPVVVRLARQLYALRMEELKQAIQQDEDKFLLLVSEIDDIRSGKWDTKLMKLIVDNNNDNATLMHQEEKEIVDKENRENEERMKERKRRDQEQDQEDQRPAKRPREEDSAASTPITTPAISTVATPTAGGKKTCFI